MSEHLSVTGNVAHGHSPQQIFAYCWRCKKENTKLIIELDQTFMGFHVSARCPKCKRCIWECPADVDEMVYWHKKKDKKCCICGKPTNEADAVAFGGLVSKKKMKYWCSEKCYNIQERKDKLKEKNRK